jgi:putative membrane protein
MPETQLERATVRGEAKALRAIFGGTLMGLANLVPGISGGTMLLAAGVYGQFIDGVAELSTFRFRPRSMLPLACILGAAGVAFVTFAGPVSHLVVHHRWVMYALFIGLTLGGVPVLWRLIGRADATIVMSSVAGIAVMAATAIIPAGDSAPADGGPRAMLVYFLGGLLGAVAMVLPGISGGYLLLVLGQYVAILSAVADAKGAMQRGDWAGLMDPLAVIIPVGMGVIVGVVGVSNLIRLLLARLERPTLGVLLGLLLGAVLGLWPFQEPAPPQVGAAFRGDVVAERDGHLIMERSGLPIDEADFPTRFFRPAPVQIGAALGLMAAGFAISLAVAHLGRDRAKVL